MAWYSSPTVRYRGRLVEVWLRYGCYQSAKVIKGKPLPFPYDCSANTRHDRRVIARLMQLVERQCPASLQAPEGW